MKIPKFKSLKEEEEFWQNTDTSEWMDDLEFIPAGVGRISEDRCPVCRSRRHKRLMNLQIANRRITLHRVRVYYCPKCKTTTPALNVKAAIPELVKAAKKAGL